MEDNQAGTTNSTITNSTDTVSAPASSASQGTAKTQDTDKPVSKTKSKELKKATVGSKIEVVGPYDKLSGAEIFRFERENNKKPTLDLLAGHTLSVGGNDGDITKAEAEFLLANNQWEFKVK